MSSVTTVNSFFGSVYKKTGALAAGSVAIPFSPFILGLMAGVHGGFDMNREGTAGAIAGGIFVVILSPLTISMAAAGLALSISCAVSSFFVHALALAGAGIVDCANPEREFQSIS